MKGTLETKESDWDRFKKAIETGNAHQVQTLLETNFALINDKDENGTTPLHMAVRAGNEKIVHIFLKIKPELINSVDNKAKTALHWAAWYGHEKIAGTLLKAKPELISAITGMGGTALHYAAANGHEKLVDILLKSKPSLVAAIDYEGNTPLHLAVLKNHEKAVKTLIKFKPGLSNIVNQCGKTALHIAIEKNYENIIGLLTNGNIGKLKDGIIELYKINAASEDKLKALEAAENENIARLDQADKGPYYLQKEIHKILSAQLQNEKNVNIEVLELQNFTKDLISEQQLQNYIDSTIKGNKTLVIALHLHQRAWAGLVLKRLGDNNLQVIYNDPTGNALTKEPAVQGLINALMERNCQGDINVTDLRQPQQKTEADSGALAVENLVRLATTKSFKKAELQQLLPRSEEIAELKIKHLLLIEEVSLEYSSCKLKKILELSLKDYSVYIAPVTSFEDKLLLVQNVKVATGQVIGEGTSVIIPLSSQNCRSGLAIKKQSDGSLQVIYNNPTGNALITEKNATLLISGIMELSPEVHVFDIRCKQGDNSQASGAFTVNNLIKIALCDTNNFHKEDFQKLLSVSVSENSDELQKQHALLVYNYVIPHADSGKYADLNLAQENREPFEQKGDYQDIGRGHVEHIDAPPDYNDALQMHVLGGNILEGNVDT